MTQQLETEACDIQRRTATLDALALDVDAQVIEDVGGKRG
jgi:hypothetical protein